MLCEVPGVVYFGSIFINNLGFHCRKRCILICAVSLSHKKSLTFHIDLDMCYHDDKVYVKMFKTMDIVQIDKQSYMLFRGVYLSYHVWVYVSA